MIAGRQIGQSGVKDPVFRVLAIHIRDDFIVHEELGARMMKKIFQKLKLPREHLAYVEKLVRLHLRPMALVDTGVTDSAVRRLVFETGDDIDDLMILCRADITSRNPALVARYRENYEIVIRKIVEVEERDRLRNWQPPVKGDEIMTVCALGEGRTVGTHPAISSRLSPMRGRCYRTSPRRAGDGSLNSA